MKAQVITGNFNNLPPLKSVGVVESLGGTHILFVPDEDSHLPPEYDRAFFSGYLLDFRDVRVILEDENDE